MDEVVADLAACLADSTRRRARKATMIVRPGRRRRGGARPSRQQRRRRLLLPLALAALLLAAAVGIFLLVRGDSGASQERKRRRHRRLQGGVVRPRHRATGRSTTSASRTRPTATRRPTGQPRPTRRSPKPGVRARAGRGLTRALERIELTSDTPGFTAEIRADARAGARSRRWAPSPRPAPDDLGARRRRGALLRRLDRRSRASPT